MKYETVLLCCFWISGTGLRCNRYFSQSSLWFYQGCRLTGTSKLAMKCEITEIMKKIKSYTYSTEIFKKWLSTFGANVVVVMQKMQFCSQIGKNFEIVISLSKNTSCLENSEKTNGTNYSNPKNRAILGFWCWSVFSPQGKLMAPFM